MIAVLACAALASACGSSSSSSTSTTATNLNTHHVELAIKQSILEKRHLHASVSCPAKVAQEKGTTFVCTATTTTTTKPPVVAKTPFKVTVESNKGYVTYVGE
jgi:hypothetical protein